MIAHSFRCRTLRATFVCHVLLAAACAGGDSEPTPPPPTPVDALRGIGLSPSTDNITVGDTRTLTATADRAAATVNVSLSYASSATAVATVNGDGVVTALAPGAATITVTAVGSGAGFVTNTRTATANITVVPRPSALTAFNVSPDSAVIAPGTTVALTTSVTSAAGATVVYSYATSTPAVAAVSNAGVVTALTGGTSVIRVTASATGTGLEPSTRSDSVLIRVVPPPAITMLTLAADSVDVVAFREQTVNATVAAPAGAPTALLSATSSSTTTATAMTSGGSIVITGASPGTATITVRASAPASATFAAASVERLLRVRVLPAPDALRSVSLTPARDTLQAGDAVTLTVSTDLATPLATVTRTFRSTAAAVATVNASGVVTGVAPGSALIIVDVTASAAGFTTRALADTTQIVVIAAPVLGIGFGDEQFAAARGGQFQMGSVNGDADEVPLRQVTTNPIRMQRTEVTQAQWQQVMQGTSLANPSADASCGPTCPVETVSWLDVQEFLTRLNAQQPGKGYRLPTEAEWEQWARAGTTTDYAGNGVLDDMGWWSGNSGGRKKPVAQKRSNAWGLYDMHGNVWEWVSDWYGPYIANSLQNPTGQPTGTQRVRRGGAFNSTTNSPRSANRGSGNSADFDRGFRVVMSVLPN